MSYAAAGQKEVPMATDDHARRQLDALVLELEDRWGRRIAGLESRGKHWSAPTKKRADEVRCCLAELRTEIAKLRNDKLTDGGHETARLKPRRDAAVRWSAC